MPFDYTSLININYAHPNARGRLTSYMRCQDETTRINILSATTQQGLNVATQLAEHGEAALVTRTLSEITNQEAQAALLLTPRSARTAGSSLISTLWTMGQQETMTQIIAAQTAGAKAQLLARPARADMTPIAHDLCAHGMGAAVLNAIEAQSPQGKRRLLQLENADHVALVLPLAQKFPKTTQHIISQLPAHQAQGIIEDTPTLRAMFNITGRKGALKSPYDHSTRVNTPAMRQTQYSVD